MRFLGRNYFARRYPELVPSLVRRVDSYNQDLVDLRRLESEGRVLLVRPRIGTPPVASYEQKKSELLRGARSGAEALYEALFGSSPRFYELLVSSEEEGRPLWGHHPPERRRWWQF